MSIVRNGKAPAEGRHRQGMNEMKEVIDTPLHRQTWMWALRLSMGWPPLTPACDSIAWVSGRPIDVETGLDCARLAAKQRQDIVYGSWGTAGAEPLSYAVIVREILTIDVVDRCLPWAADEFAPLILVSTKSDESIAIDARGLLHRHAGKPEKLAAGRRLAAKRIRTLAASLRDRVDLQAWASRHEAAPEAMHSPMVRFN